LLLLALVAELEGYLRFYFGFQHHRSGSCMRTGGYLWARRGYRYETGFVTLLVTNVGFPCLILETLTAVELNAGVILLMGLAALATTTIFAVVATCILKPQTWICGRFFRL